MEILAKVFVKKLNAFNKAVKDFFNDFRPIWKQQGVLVKKSITKNVDEKLAGFTPLTKTALAWRARKNYSPDPPLHASGAMLKSFGQFERSERKTYYIGTRIPYAAIQQSGSKRFNVTARPWVAVTDELSNELSVNTSEYLAKAIDTAQRGVIEK